MTPMRSRRAARRFASCPMQSVIVGCLCWGAASGAGPPSSVPSNPTTDSAQASKAVEAAKRATDGLFRQDTPEYTAAFRHLVGAMMKAQAAAPNAEIFDTLTSVRLTPFDADPLFRANVAKTAALSMRTDLIQPYVLVSKPDTDQFPDVVLLQGPGLQICSGIIIKTNRVLTARHCVCDGVTTSIGLGSVYSSLERKPIVEQRPTKQECAATPSSNIDIGVVYTDNGVVRSNKFPPYATTNLINASAAAMVVGYGVSIFGSANSAGDRRYAPVSVVSGSCEGSGPNTNGAIVADSVRFGCVPKLTLVAASTSGADQCSGDSGGALLAVDSTGKRFLAAVVSSPTVASALHGGCGAGGIYVRLDTQEVSKWIADNT